MISFGPKETAHQAWLVLEVQFLNNRESHVLQLKTRFHIFKQGDLSVSDYCDIPPLNKVG
jgi:hypothetical protein